MYVGMNYGWFIRESMNHAVFLDIGTTPYPDVTDIASQDSARANVTPCFDDHIPDQYGLGLHKGFRIRIRSFSFKFIERHNDSSQRPNASSAIL